MNSTVDLPGVLATHMDCRPAWEPLPDKQLISGFTSDLLSDVIANCPEQAVLITIQGHKNTVAAASLAGASAIVVCSGRPLPNDMVEAARNEGLALLSVQGNQFEVSCLIGKWLENDL